MDLEEAGGVALYFGHVKQVGQREFGGCKRGFKSEMIRKLQTTDMQSELWIF